MVGKGLWINDSFLLLTIKPQTLSLTSSLFSFLSMKSCFLFTSFVSLYFIEEKGSEEREVIRASLSYLFTLYV